MANVTKEVLLWFDLEEKIRNRDPQWMSIGTDLWTTPNEILSVLAKRARWPISSQGVTLPRAELAEHFPGFDRARIDLVDQRILVSSNLSEAVVSSDHLVLGWALILREAAKGESGESCDALCDRLRCLLEPAASNDDKARAVHVAAILTFLDSEFHVVGRTALLRLWAFHHNATVTAEGLGFFSKVDLSSYAAMVEAFFRNYLPERFESTLIVPLAVLWRDRVGDMAEIQKKLERWLRLVFPGDASGSKEGNESPPSHFPKAETPKQLRLSYAAASIISFRADHALLPALVDCYHSARFCCYDDEASGSQEKRRSSFKNPNESLGVLARWHYGEQAIGVLAELAISLPYESRERRSLNWFARLWRQARLPAILGDTEGADQNRLIRILPIEELRNWLLDRGNTTSRRYVGIGELERMAVRRDHGELSYTEVEMLISEVRARVAATAGCDHYSGTWEARAIDDLLPWLARSAPVVFNSEIREMWKIAVTSKATLSHLLHLDELLPADDLDGELVAKIMNRRDYFSQLDGGAHAATVLTQIMLLHADETQLYNWFKSLETLEFVSCWPLPTAMQILAPVGLGLLAREEAENSIRAVLVSPEDATALTRASHWLEIYSILAEPSREAAVWALGLSDALPEKSGLRFSLFQIASKSTDKELVRRTVFHPAFRQYHFGRIAGYWTFRMSPEDFSFAELADNTSLTFVGRLLFWRENDDELCLWGRVVTSAARKELSVADVRAPSQICFTTEASSDGGFDGFRVKSLPWGRKEWFGISSGVWGVDRQSEQSSASEADYARLYGELHELMKARIGTDRREITEFNAAGALWRWSKVEPELFTEFATDFLIRISKADTFMKMECGFFTEVVFIGLLRLSPSLALHLDYWDKQGGHVTTLSGTLDLITAALWERELNGFAEVDDAHRKALLLASNDEVIFRHSLAALYGGNGRKAAEEAAQFVASCSARERALGVTLLAYQGDEQSFDELTRLREDDPSFWVRTHAEWALEVCASEIACRNRYRSIVEAESLHQMAAGLAEIRMALTPLARAWRREFEEKAENFKKHPKMRAYLELFWYNWGNASSRQRDIRIAGRKLQEYCRGEKLSRGITDHMAPWWDLGM